MAKDKIHLSAWDFVNKVFLRSACTTVFAFLLPGLLCVFQADSILRMLEVCFVSVLGSLLAIYFVGLDKLEREFVNNMIRRRVLKHS